MTSTPVTFIGEYPLPFQSCPKRLFQREAKCDAIDIKKCFFSPMKQNFYKKGFALSLVLEWEK